MQDAIACLRAVIRRLDHVAIVVRSTDEALRFFLDELGLKVASTEEAHASGVRLTYLDCGNAYLQLIEPIVDGTEIQRFLEERGEGIHHFCFAVDDVVESVELFSGDGAAVQLGTGRGRASAFLPGATHHGARIECTEFSPDEDIANPGYLR
jgi:methylmalonyl-CoA/ethylmalonyl-CoA epimerase